MKFIKVLAIIIMAALISISLTVLFVDASSIGAGKLMSGDIDDLLNNELQESGECCVKIPEEELIEMEKESEQIEIDLSDFQDTLKTRNESVIQITNKVGPMYGIDPLLLQAIIFTESSNNPNAENGSCRGYMQVSDKWHWDRMEKLGIVNIYDPYENILVGTDYLSELLLKYDGDVALSLMVYNGDSNANYLHSIGEKSVYATKIINLHYRLTLLEELLNSAASK